MLGSLGVIHVWLLESHTSFHDNSTTAQSKRPVEVTIRPPIKINEWRNWSAKWIDQWCCGESVLYPPRNLAIVKGQSQYADLFSDKSELRMTLLQRSS